MIKPANNCPICGCPAEWNVTRDGELVRCSRGACRFHYDGNWKGFPYEIWQKLSAHAAVQAGMIEFLQGCIRKFEEIYRRDLVDNRMKMIGASKELLAQIDALFEAGRS
jgi:hypothetical protein